MAVHRESPTCPHCNKVIAEAIHKDYTGVPMMQIPFGDSFVRWKYEKHDCKEGKAYWKKWRKTPEGKKLVEAVKAYAESLKIQSTNKTTKTKTKQL